MHEFRLFNANGKKKYILKRLAKQTTKRENLSIGTMFIRTSRLLAFTRNFVVFKNILRKISQICSFTLRRTGAVLGIISMRKYQICSCFLVESNLATRPYRITRSLIRSPIKQLNLKKIVLVFDVYA
ncbi:hypothetical protein [uncultured Campylobacter sp.]|uniref:hypothetical protein n=1 Tax=uncultured Campylobacter sp. TaxID=218934 RepID=UPI0026208191|nr:hypothetical protein [uncultured Campylobacter sp.]